MWLLTAQVARKIEAAVKTGPSLTAEQQNHFEAARTALSSDSNSRIMSVAGNVAEISVAGVLTPKPSWMAMIFGGGNTTYPEISHALAVAAADPNVTEIILDIDSPGGAVDGLFDCVAALEANSMPMTARVSNMAASAAYAIASQADSIIATNRAASFGSIGIAVTYYKSENYIDITSTNAPNKRPDVSTAEGKAVVIEELDALHEVFVDAIATGRGTTAERINADFGQGAIFLADKALKNGMIDSVASPKLTAVANATVSNTEKAAEKNPTSSTAKSGIKARAKKMDLNQLKTQHPDTYAAAVQDGVAKERDRAGAHITAGEMSGDMKTALQAAKDGTEMTQTLSTQYMMAAANRSNIKARENDDTDAVDDLTGDDETHQQSEASAAIVKQAKELCGIEAKGE